MCIYPFMHQQKMLMDKSPSKRKDLVLKYVTMAEYLQRPASVSPFELKRPSLIQKGKLEPRNRVGCSQLAQARNGGPVWERAGYTKGRAPKRPEGGWPGVGEAEGRDPVWPVGPVLSLAQGGGGCG